MTYDNDGDDDGGSGGNGNGNGDAVCLSAIKRNSKTNNIEFNLKKLNPNISFRLFMMMNLFYGAL